MITSNLRLALVTKLSLATLALSTSFVANAVTSGPINATAYSGLDIGAQVNNAFASAACNNICTVYVPQGQYSFATQFAWPVSPNGIYINSNWTLEQYSATRDHSTRFLSR